ncbi:MAG TPA: TetR/AcrR family transcriptional regulator [Nitriliruptorales bacterium]|nr:TetR/AcrR family transcriptional regulator [Nitriliruptorales bacterium]
MGAQADRPLEAAAGMSRERVLNAAVALADREGLEALTMRRLARELGAGTMTLYHYVADKDDLLDGMVDVVFSEIDLPATDADWRTAMRERAASVREALARHPWASGLMELRMTPGPTSLRHHESVLECLRGAGFSIQDATHAYWILDSYIYGFSIQEASLPFGTPEQLAEMAEVVLPRLPAAEYPRLNEAAAASLESGHDYTDEFEFGLDLILDGLERLRN